jgi:PAS domain S-box-containing protein
MIIGNADGYYERVNPAFAHMLGLTIEELLARPINTLLHPDDAAMSLQRESDLQAGRDVPPLETRYRCKDGSYRWILWTVPPADERRLTYAVGKDVTERREMEDRLRVSEHQAQEASRLKSEFVASMSHELRTPLNGVIGMTDLLRYTPLDHEQAGYVKALGASSEALLTVINDVLDFSKMEAGHLKLDPTDFDLRGAIEEATLMLAGQAHAKGLEIGHWVDADVPVTVHADRARVRQVLLNLLSNAVKFTTTGEVTLRVTSLPGGELHLAVSDTGIGIDEAHAAALFEAFAQADQSTTRQYGGTGLGLAISRRLVELMGGAIGAAPRDGGGSVFWFSAVMPAVTGPAAEAPSRPDLQARRILVVDDNQTNRTILEHYLRSWGVACESFDRPSTAIDALERAAGQGQPFELAVFDVNLPQMDGIELVREIRRRPALGTLKVVLMSSAAFELDQLEDIGVSATLTKPARQSEIYEAITDALAGGRSRESPAPAPVAKPIAIKPGQLVLIADDNEINYTLAEALFSAIGLQTAVARNGREAVAMALAGDYAAIFMDCQMPEVDGFEAARQIRAAESARRIPIVAMTALSMPGDRQRCLAAGMDDYLSKPIRREELEAVIVRWLPGSEASSRPEDRHLGAGDDEVAQVPGAVLDLAAVARIRDALTPAKYELLLDRFDAQQRTCVAEIGVAVERGDRAEVRRVAHKLKGSSASLGAYRLQLCCLALEHLELDDALGEPQLDELRGSAAEASDALRYELTH